MGPDIKEAPQKKFGPWRIICDQTLITDEVISFQYPGGGTHDDPYVVDWIPGDPRNPLRFSPLWKWIITVTAAFGTLAVSFASTAFSGAMPQIKSYFGASDEIATLTVSLFVLGFAIGPMTWAPLSELYGRQLLWVTTFFFMTVFGGASLASENVATLIVLRAFAGAIGASSIANSAGVISDIFTAKERGLGVTIYCSAPFLGPTLGPITGGFLAQAAGWKWVDAMTVIFSGVMWIVGGLIIPETYAPYLLIRRATKLSKMTGKVYVSKLELEKGRKKPSVLFRTAMTRPYIFLVMEPIVLSLSVYMAIVYGTLYMIFSGFPVVFETERHWSQGISGLSFVANMLGQIGALVGYSVFFDVRYRKALERAGGYLPPEERLKPALIGSVFLPIGLFWFAWTTYSHIPWIVPMLGSGVFGFGQVLVFLSIMNYLIDSYTIYAASTMAANAVLRAVFAAAFPLFTTYMYRNLGDQWASSVPAFLSLACVPFPFLFFKYGEAIRMKCKYSAEAQRASSQLQRSVAEKHVFQSESPAGIRDSDPEA
ncbi:MFS general substrate transporter [Talaromyces proteolyticus]|uniref:MFS general substrate transporter n=1 Tax=Talaromyces proteolyticus TaxID=1131652 RepID=A0AAD4KLQ1_9EURO|nr:MFS general substrate transporter [Talaromyces proteolyticus]KAH8694084.1 MFS general substrate transporter [Talaromyces proteolyticus]